MFEDKKDDIFLSRWINGELSSEELSEFKSNPEYEYYLKIMAGADALKLKEYNINTALTSIKSNRKTVDHTTNLRTKTSVIKLWPYAAVAASIALILGMFLFNPNDKFSTSFGEQLSITLPDGSEMILNAKSKASFNKENWEKDRTVSLDGEAYFKVKKGSKFTVTTQNGNVSVLGTEFNVQSYPAYFESVCYEGKVRVATDSDTTILTAGKGYRNIENKNPEQWTFEAQEPSWIHYTSSFRSVPLQYVFNQLEKQYNITIDARGIDASIIYTGTFPNDNKEVAFKTVFSTLGLQYELLQDGKTLVLEK